MEEEDMPLSSFELEKLEDGMVHAAGWIGFAIVIGGAMIAAAIIFG